MPALVWFRRDLRLTDHAALSAAMHRHQRVHCVFVFDLDILEALESRTDRRVEFIWQSVLALKQQLQALGSDLQILHASARSAIPALAKQLKISAVYANHDYEPDTIQRDIAVQLRLNALGIGFNTSKDCAIFEKDEVLTKQAKPFSVFTPYKTAWLAKLSAADLQEHPVEQGFARLAQVSQPSAMPSLEQLGFAPSGLSNSGVRGGAQAAQELLADFIGRIDLYHETRNFPAIKGVSYLSVHNRFGTCSIRALARAACRALDAAPDNQGAQTWLNELIWRDFYFQILWHNPQVVRGCFRPQYDALQWENNENLFRAWCEARTGYPIIDAAMRQLNQTGYMHNRLRMVVASFLTKDLLVDWRWGERYFARQLLDFDLAANNGGWQWAASTGCDAQPYFRIFNPVAQSERFDPKGKFIRRYLPELARLPDKFLHAPWQLTAAQQAELGVHLGKDYPFPVVDHATQRQRALAMFKLIGQVPANH